MNIKSLLNPEPLPRKRRGITESPSTYPHHSLDHQSLPDLVPLDSEQVVRKKPRPDSMAPKQASALKATNGTVNFPTYENLAASFERQLHRFSVKPTEPDCRIHESPATIPYSSGKRTFSSMTGRDGFEIFKYTFNYNHSDDLAEVKIHGANEVVHTVMWDYNIGLVRITSFFKSLDHNKTIPKKVLDANGLLPISYNITGGNIAAQGYWIPFHAARAIAANYCWPIRWALVPVFGQKFVHDCVHPLDPGFQRATIDPSIVIACSAGPLGQALQATSTQSSAVSTTKKKQKDPSKASKMQPNVTKGRKVAKGAAKSGESETSASSWEEGGLTEHDESEEHEDEISEDDGEMTNAPLSYKHRPKRAAATYNFEREDTTASADGGNDAEGTVPTVEEQDSKGFSQTRLTTPQRLDANKAAPDDAAESALSSSRSSRRRATRQSRTPTNDHSRSGAPSVDKFAASPYERMAASAPPKYTSRMVDRGTLTEESHMHSASPQPTKQRSVFWTPEQFKKYHQVMDPFEKEIRASEERLRKEGRSNEEVFNATLDKIMYDDIPGLKSSNSRGHPRREDGPDTTTGTRLVHYPSSTPSAGSTPSNRRRQKVGTGARDTSTNSIPQLRGPTYTANRHDVVSAPSGWQLDEEAESIASMEIAKHNLALEKRELSQRKGAPEDNIKEAQAAKGASWYYGSQGPVLLTEDERNAADILAILGIVAESEARKQAAATRREEGKEGEAGGQVDDASKKG